MPESSDQVIQHAREVPQTDARLFIALRGPWDLGDTPRESAIRAMRGAHTDRKQTEQAVKNDPDPLQCELSGLIVLA